MTRFEILTNLKAGTDLLDMLLHRAFASLLDLATPPTITPNHIFCLNALSFGSFLVAIQVDKNIVRLYSVKMAMIKGGDSI